MKSAIIIIEAERFGLLASDLKQAGFWRIKKIPHTESKVKLQVKFKERDFKKVQEIVLKYQ